MSLDNHLSKVAPPLHPPYNITSSDMKTISWTVSLNWAMPFFIGLSDSNGSMWSNGPLHAGGGGTIGCLSGNVTSRSVLCLRYLWKRLKCGSSERVGVPVAIGLAFVVLIFGIMSGVGGSFAFVAYRKRKLDHFVQIPEGGTSPSGALETRESQRRPRPFPTLEEQEQVPGPPNNQVYVLHHDGNTAPVTIFHQEGTNVVELPPTYPFSRRQSEAAAEHQDGSSPSCAVSRSPRGPVNLTAQERREFNHYNPRGPWQPRRPTAIRKPSDPGPFWYTGWSISCLSCIRRLSVIGFLLRIVLRTFWIFSHLPRWLTKHCILEHVVALVIFYWFYASL